MRSHFVAVCSVLQKGFHSVCNGTFSHDEENKKEKAKVWMTLQPFEPQVKYHCVSVSPEWLSPNTPVTADWKSMRTFMKATKCPLKLIQKMSLSFLSKCCVWGLQSLDSWFKYFTRRKETRWKKFQENVSFISNDYEYMYSCACEWTCSCFRWIMNVNVSFTTEGCGCRYH